MTINIGEINVSVPNGISDWVHQNDDNKTEFDGMIESLMYAVKTFYKNKYKPNPYQEIYEQQVKELMGLNCESREDGSNTLINLIKEINNK